MEVFTLELVFFSSYRIYYRADGVNTKDTAIKFLKILLLVCKEQSMLCVSGNFSSRSR